MAVPHLRHLQGVRLLQVYWSMYRLARDHDLIEAVQDPIWYLKQAFLTIQVPSCDILSAVQSCPFTNVLLLSRMWSHAVLKHCPNKGTGTMVFLI